MYELDTHSSRLLHHWYWSRRMVCIHTDRKPAMGTMKDHLANGIISLALSLVITAVTAKREDGPWSKKELLVAVGISSFLSGFFTSYYAK